MASSEDWDFNKLLSTFVKSQKDSTEAFNNVANALHEMNDKNALHFAQDNKRMEVVEANTIVTRSIVEENKKYYKLFTWAIVVFISVFVLLIIALLVLAGAEKAVNLFPGFFKNLI